MEKTHIYSIFLVVALVLSGCGKPSSETTNSGTNNTKSSIEPAPVIAEVKADPIVFESDSKLGLALGMLGEGDALLKKKLGTSVGKPIQITSMFVWSYDGSEWEKGGKLHLMNDDSMGRAYRITCSISSENGDKFMETKKRRVIVASGILKDYSSSYGLTIDPCNATWEESDTPK
jgi:hypothetical protein